MNINKLRAKSLYQGGATNVIQRAFFDTNFSYIKFYTNMFLPVCIIFYIIDTNADINFRGKISDISWGDITNLVRF